jgi:hypothetical protein
MYAERTVTLLDIDHIEAGDGQNSKPFKHVAHAVGA